MYTFFPIHSPTDEPLDCFCLLGMATNAAIYTAVTNTSPSTWCHFFGAHTKKWGDWIIQYFGLGSNKSAYTFKAYSKWPLIFNDKADWKGILLVSREWYNNELTKSRTPGARIPPRPFQLHDPGPWVPWTSIFEQGLRICTLTSCLIQGITALGLAQCCPFYQVSTSSFGQPASYQYLLWDSSLMFSHEACPCLSDHADQTRSGLGFI